MPDRSSVVKAAIPRDLRLDVFRGLCLVMIFINHVPGTIYENYTSRNFGFSDAAEGFVLMSGVAAGLAYSTPFRVGFSWQAVGRVWRRAWTLYMVHAMTTLMALGILSLGALHLGAGELLSRNAFGTFLSQPLAVHIGMPALTYQLGYVNILPMYMVLLLMAPFMLWMALRRPFVLWALSAALWLAAGMLAWNLPNYPFKGGWFFNPLSWQFIFCTGLLTGVAMKQGHRFLPVMTWLQVLTGTFLLIALASAMTKTVSSAVGYSLWTLQDLGVPRIFTRFDKTYASAPRLFHILALAYFLSTFPIVKRLSGAKPLRVLVLLGRNALPVFALGSMLALMGQVIKTALPTSFALDTGLILGGLALQVLFAWALEKGRLTR